MNAVHNEVDCLTEGVAWFTTVLDQADHLPRRQWWRFHLRRRWESPDEELRALMPYLLAELSPGARLLLRDKHSHVTELVVGLHQAIAHN